MLGDILQNIMLLKFTDKIKELLIEKTLQANQELDEEGCVSVLNTGVRFVFLALSNVCNDACKLFSS
jgi:2-iminoacetate synthase ThiH